MNKPLIVGATTLTLLFGGAGVAAASTLDAPATTTTVAQAQESHDDDNGDHGLWGLTGLLGLIGLAGLKRRKDADYPANRGGGTITNNPRA